MPVGISLPMYLVTEPTTFTDEKKWVLQVGETARVSVVFRNCSSNASVKWGSYHDNAGVVGATEDLDLTSEAEGVVVPSISSAAASVMELTLPAGTSVDFLAIEMI